MRVCDTLILTWSRKGKWRVPKIEGKEAMKGLLMGEGNKTPPAMGN
jgi:hypothetical protein